MKTTAPFPVTEANFDTCWKYVDRLRRKSRVMCAVAEIGGFWSNLFLLFSLLFLVNGLIYSQFSGLYHNFLAMIPGFSALWDTFTSLILNPGDSLTIQVLKLLLGCYALSALVFIALAVVVALLYHPRKKAVPEGTYKDRTVLLAKAAEEAWSRSYRTKLSTSILSTVILVVAAVILVSTYVIYSGDSETVSTYISTFPTSDFTVNCWLFVFATYFVSDFFSTVFLLVTRFIYRYQFPYDLMAQSAAAALYADEDFQDLSEEEISLRRKERREALRLEALSLEKEAAHTKAKNMLHDAALLGDVPAMEHFARHCILLHLNDSARYWLKRCISTGEAGKGASRMLLRLNLRLNHNVHYLRPENAPLTKWQKVRMVLKTTLTVIWRVLILALLILFTLICILLFKNNFDLAIFQDLPGAFARFLS